MAKNMFEALNTKITAESDEKVLRLAATLRGHKAEAFLHFHEKLGGAKAISRNDLAARILAHALEEEPQGRRQRKAGGEQVVD